MQHDECAASCHETFFQRCRIGDLPFVLGVGGSNARNKEEFS
jgi:hypothetical protein